MSRKELQHIKLKYLNNKTKPSFKQEGFVAGIAPYLRGANATMYIRKPWNIRHYDGFPTAEESNIFYKKKIETGQKELSITFDLPTKKGYNSNHKSTQEKVGKNGVAIDSVEDMKILFNKIPLDKISIHINKTNAALPILAFFIVTAEEQGVSLDKLSGTILNNFPKELITTNTKKLPTSASLKIITDILKYTSSKMPKFNSVSISNYHKQEIGCATEIEIAHTLTEGVAYIKKGIEAGLDIDFLAQRLTFSWKIGMNHFTEIAKLRAARVLWAKIVKQFNPKHQNSLILKSFCQTNQTHLTTEEPFDLITKTTIEAMAAVFGGTQDLNTNTLDKTILITKDSSSRIARNTQIYLQKETAITKTVDPWAGSYHLEKLTEDLITDTWKLITEIEKHGKIVPDIKKEEVVTVDKTLFKQEKSLAVLKQNKDVTLTTQIKKINILKDSRDNLEVKKTLDNLSLAYKSGKENLLDLAVEAARNRCTIEEISDAVEIILE